jgi:hypothetical protein
MVTIPDAQDPDWQLRILMFAMQLHSVKQERWIRFLQSSFILLMGILIGFYSPLFSGRLEYILSQQVIGPFIVACIIAGFIAIYLGRYEQRDWTEVTSKVVNVLRHEMASGQSIPVDRFQELLGKILPRERDGQL